MCKLVIRGFTSKGCIPEMKKALLYFVKLFRALTKAIIPLAKLTVSK